MTLSPGSCGVVLHVAVVEDDIEAPSVHCRTPGLHTVTVKENFAFGSHLFGGISVARQPSVYVGNWRSGANIMI